MLHVNLQIEQEMAIIVGRSDIRASFERRWTASYVPGLILYGERSKKKSLKEIHAQLVDSGINPYTA